MVYVGHAIDKWNKGDREDPTAILQLLLQLLDESAARLPLCFNNPAEKSPHWLEPRQAERSALIQKTITAEDWHDGSRQWLGKVLYNNVAPEELADDLRKYVTEATVPLISEVYRERVLLACYQLQLNDQAKPRSHVKT